MIFISHRGNLRGRDDSRENTWAYILEAIEKGFHVEIDVWYIDGKFYLGHDEPGEEIGYIDLINRSNYLWVHCKNSNAVWWFSCTNVNHFWHENDLLTHTSYGKIWMNYKVEPIPGSIAVLPEIIGWTNYKDWGGVCSDVIEWYKENETISRRD